jgi:hypothetical protein
MDHTTPYAAPVNRGGRIFALALAAVGLAGAGIGIGVAARSRTPDVAPSPVVHTVEIAAPKPAPPVDASPRPAAELERLLQVLNEAEAQRREDARKASERTAELERLAATTRQDEAARRAENERRAAEEAQRRLAAEQQAAEEAQRRLAAEQRAQDEARQVNEERRRAAERARVEGAWDTIRQLEAERQAEAQRRAAQALEEDRRRVEAVRRRLAERAAAVSQVTAIGLWADRPTARGPLPQTVRFTGWITADGPTTVHYRFVHSDGGLSAVQTLTFARAGRQPVSTTWSLGARFSGWVALEVLDPNPVTSARAAFTVTGP